MASEEAQGAIDAHVRMLEVQGPNLGYPYTSAINGSRHGHMRELRVQSKGRPLRISFAFDPHRTAILLIGGDKTGYQLPALAHEFPRSNPINFGRSRVPVRSEVDGGRPPVSSFNLSIE